MSYESTVYRILIASPSDVEEEREIAARLIRDWNDLYSFNKKIVLLPVRWETHSSPTYGIRPQEALNKQIVDECDLLIGFFWTKIGSPTGKEISGTIEEIKRVSKAGKPVMLYFSKRGKDPSLIDLSQLDMLNTFKTEIYSSALVENYNSVADFRDKLSRQLEMKIRELQSNKVTSKNLINFSFINKANGSFLKNKQKIEIERIEFDNNSLNQIIKKDKRVKERKKDFHDAIVTYANRKNNMPIIFGLKNNTERTFSNINLELDIKTSKKNSLNIQFYGDPDDASFLYYQASELLSKENENNIRNLFGNNVTQNSQNSWNFNLIPLTILPNKIKIIESLLLLYPKDSMKINFTISLYSENVLQTIEDTCTMEISYKKREITSEEIEEIIIKLPEEDDFPF